MCAKSSIASYDVMQTDAVIQHVFMLLLNKYNKFKNWFVGFEFMQIFCSLKKMSICQ